MYEKTHWLWNSSVELSALKCRSRFERSSQLPAPSETRLIKFFAHEKELGRMFKK